MKNPMVKIICLVLLLATVFTMPANAVSLLDYSKEIKGNPGTRWYGEGLLNHPGSNEYWRIRTMVEKSWNGANRPAPLMGDANLNGKVDAGDALFALYFSVYGNEQTYQVAECIKTPCIMRWEGEIYGLAFEGKAEELAGSPEFWWIYCRMNSPFFADVTKDCVVNALDALEILKYTVGKAKDFPVNDFTSLYPAYFLYYPWPTECTPGFYQSNDFANSLVSPTDVTPTNR